MDSLQGKTALVTGAGGVLGFATAEALAAEGMTVVLADIEADRLPELASQIGEAAVPLVLDVSDPDMVNAACKRIVENHDGVDVLVNNAGILSNNKSAETSPEEWRRIMSVNLDGAFYLSRACLPGMKAKGWGAHHQRLLARGENGRLDGGNCLHDVEGRHGHTDIFFGSRSSGFWSNRKRRSASLHQNPHGHRTTERRST